MADFQALTDVSLAESNRNDADSFDVKVGEDDVRNFRLYFVDAPETSFSFPDRLRTQSGRFGVAASQVPRLGEKARARAQELLKNEKFHVITRGERAQGDGDNLGERTYAIVQFPEKRGTEDEFLHTRLVKEGLAAPGGLGASIPGFIDEKTTQAQLAGLAPQRKSLPGGKKFRVGVTPRQFIERPEFKNASPEKKAEYMDKYTSMIQGDMDKAGIASDASSMARLRDTSDRFLVRALLEDKSVDEKQIAELMAKRAFPEGAFELDENATAYVRSHPDPRKRDLAQVIVQDNTSKQSQALTLPKSEIMDKSIGTVLFENRDQLKDGVPFPEDGGFVDNLVAAEQAVAPPNAVGNFTRRAASGLIGTVVGDTIKGLAITLGLGEDSRSVKTAEWLKRIGDGIVARGTIQNRLRQFAPTIKERLPVSLGEGAGQVAGALLTGGAVAGAGKLTAAAAMGSQAYGQITSEAYTQARSLGADEESARSAAMTAGLLGAPLETLADLTLVRLMNIRAVTEAAHNGGWGSALGKMLGGSATEAGTEAAQTISTNHVLAQQIADSVKLSDGVKEAALVGGILGGGVGGVGGVSKALTKMDPKVRERILADMDAVKSTKAEKEQLSKDTTSEIDLAGQLPEEQLKELRAIKGHEQLVEDAGGEVSALEYLGTYTALRTAGKITEDVDGTQIVKTVDDTMARLEEEYSEGEVAEVTDQEQEAEVAEAREAVEDVVIPEPQQQQVPEQETVIEEQVPEQPVEVPRSEKPFDRPLTNFRFGQTQQPQQVEQETDTDELSFAPEDVISRRREAIQNATTDEQVAEQLQLAIVDPSPETAQPLEQALEGPIIDITDPSPEFGPAGTIPLPQRGSAEFGPATGRGPRRLPTSEDLTNQLTERAEAVAQQVPEKAEQIRRIARDVIIPNALRILEGRRAEAQANLRSLQQDLEALSQPITERAPEPVSTEPSETTLTGRTIPAPEPRQSPPAPQTPRPRIEAPPTRTESQRRVDRLAQSRKRAFDEANRGDTTRERDVVGTKERDQAHQEDILLERKIQTSSRQNVQPRGPVEPTSQARQKLEERKARLPEIKKQALERAEKKDQKRRSISGRSRSTAKLEKVADSRVNQFLGTIPQQDLAAMSRDEFADFVDDNILFTQNDFNIHPDGVAVAGTLVAPFREVQAEAVPNAEDRKLLTTERGLKVIDRELKKTSSGGSVDLDRPLNEMIRTRAFNRYQNALAQNKAVGTSQDTRTQNAENADDVANMAADVALDLENYFRARFDNPNKLRGSRISDVKGDQGDDIQQGAEVTKQGRILEGTQAERSNQRFQRGDVQDIDRAATGWFDAYSEFLDQVTQAAERGVLAYQSAIQDIGVGPDIDVGEVSTELMALLTRKDVDRGKIIQRKQVEAAANAVAKKDALYARALKESQGDPEVFAEALNDALDHGTTIKPSGRHDSNQYKTWRPSIEHMFHDPDEVKAAREVLTPAQQQMYGALWNASWQLNQRAERKGVVREGMEEITSPLIMQSAAELARQKGVTNEDVGLPPDATLSEWEARFALEAEIIQDTIAASHDMIGLTDFALEKGIVGGESIYQSEFGTDAEYYGESVDPSLIEELEFDPDAQPGPSQPDRNTSQQAREATKGLAGFMNSVRAGRVDGSMLAAFVKGTAKTDTGKNLVDAISKVSNFKAVRVRAQKGLKSAGIAKRLNASQVDIIIDDATVRLSSNFRHTMTEELVHAASWMNNVAEGPAQDVIGRVREKLPPRLKKFANMNREDLRQAYHSKETDLQRFEYRNLYALTSAQETIAHAVLTPSFRNLMSQSGIDPDAFVEQSFGKEVAEAAKPFADEWNKNNLGRDAQAAGAANSGRQPRTAPTSDRVMSPEQLAEADEVRGMRVNQVKKWMGENTDKIVLGHGKPLTAAESAVFRQRGEQIAKILTESSINETSPKPLQLRFRMAAAALFDKRVNPSAAWNMANEIIGNTLAQRARNQLVGSDTRIAPTGKLTQSLVTTRAFARLVTETAHGEAAVMDFWNGLNRGTSALSGGGRVVHRSRMEQFEEAERKLRKQGDKTLDARDIRTALMANQLLSMPSREELQRANETGVPIDQLERDNLRANLKSWEESIRAKMKVNDNNARKRDEAQVDEEILSVIEDIAKQNSFKAAERKLEQILGPALNNYRKGMVEQFAQLRPEFRFVTEVARNQKWQDIRSYLPLVADNPHTNIHNGSKDVGKDITSENMVAEDGMIGLMDTGSLPTTIHSASLMRRGLSPNGQVYYRSMTSASLGAAFGSQSYEVATLADRQAIKQATDFHYNSERDLNKLPAIFDNANPVNQAQNVAKATQSLALKAYQHDRSGIPTGPLSEITRFATKAAYYGSLVGVAQPMVQVAPGFAGWIGASTGDGAIIKSGQWFKALMETMPWVGSKHEMFDAFIDKHAPFFATRVANADREALTAQEARLLPLWESVNTPGQKLKLGKDKAWNAIRSGLERYFTKVSNFAIGTPEKLFLRPLLLTEYRKNAMENGTISSWTDDSIMTTNVDIAALDKALETVDNIAAPSDTANRGQAFIPQGNGTLGENGKLALLAFAGHQSAMASQGARAYYQLRQGDVKGGLRALANVGIQGMAYSALYYFIAGEMQNWIRLGAAHAMGAAGAENEETLAKINERLNTGLIRTIQRGDDIQFGQRLLGAAYTGLDDAVLPMLGPLASILSTPIGTNFASLLIDNWKNKFGGSEGFWADTNISFQGKAEPLEKALAVAGPGGEIIADTFTKGLLYWPSLVLIPERAVRSGVQRTLAEDLSSK